MASVILTHLGDSVPPYLRDCVHQLRLFNPTTPVYVIANPVHTHSPFFLDLQTTYGVRLRFTDALAPTAQHTDFLRNFRGDIAFRKGYWRHVKERFFFVEELMIQESLIDVISMEYDVLVYGDLMDLCRKLHGLPQTLRMVMDNDARGHPAFLYLPTVADATALTSFFAGVAPLPYEDMQTLSLYAKLFSVQSFPVITEQRNRTIPCRKSRDGHTTNNSAFLSQHSEELGALFDSLVVGQWIGGIDSRNTGGTKIVNYENEGALYSIREMPFEWRSEGTCEGTREGTRWRPYLDGRPLFTIHVHSKALSCFLSDRTGPPTSDYDVATVNAGLLPN
jgi:hypothetical protein